MTLIVAGKILEDFSLGDIKSAPMCDGLFFVADSAITSPSGQIVVEGFKKVLRIPVRVMGMNFLDTTFNGYHGYRYDGACTIAFAGSTLVAQHILNAIGNHLGELKPTWFDGQYMLAMPCETEKLLNTNDYYDEDMFSDDYVGRDGLLTAGFIAGVVKHTIQTVLDQSKRHAGVKDYRYAMSCEFILGVRCPSDGEDYLYMYEFIENQNKEYEVAMLAIPDGEVAVIGKRDLHAEAALDHYRAAVQENRSNGEAMLEYMATAIRRAEAIRATGIGFPAYFYKAVGNRLTMEGRVGS